MSPDVIIATLKVVGVFVAVSFIVFWVGLVWWVSQDVLTRTKDKIIVSVAVAITAILGPVGILIYLVVRPRQTLKERLGEVMEQEMLMQASAITVCPTCEHLAQEDFLACPHCGTILKKPCTSCGKLLSMDWDYCPFCSAPQPTATVEVTEIVMEDVSLLDGSSNSRPVLEVVRNLINRHGPSPLGHLDNSDIGKEKLSKKPASKPNRRVAKKDHSRAKKR
jgi:RNA polymerase subunit RPABC4/transcription elongation factor Spt4